MHPVLLYAIKAVICSGILVGYYWIALRNKIFHQYNRFYLLAIVALSLLVPVIKIDFWQQQQEAIPVIKFLQATEVNNIAFDEPILASTTKSINWGQISMYAYIAVCVGMLLAFVQALAKIYLLYKRSETQERNGINLVQTEANGTPFSFLNFIFWNRNIDLNSASGKQILKHEIAHIQQKHSYDNILIKTVLILFWFNPFFWLIKKELNIIHEFTADKIAVEDSDSSLLAAMILQAAYPQHRFALSHPFFYSPIKRRLMMLTKNTHSKAGYFSRILVLPIAAFLFVAFTFRTKTVSDISKTTKKINVVIDAGHGGKDFGATDGNSSYEKDITLSIAKKVKALNTNANINIILSRETDIYQTPNEKADFINNTGADFAITIHVDGTSKKSFDIKTGMSAWVANDEYPNSKESKVLASVIIQSFQANYPLEIMPQPLLRNKGIWILKATKCPTVLLEAGFITNKKDAAFLISDAGQELAAKNILLAIEQYAAIDKEFMTDTSTKEHTYNKPDIQNKLNNTLVAEKMEYKQFDMNKALIVENGKILGNSSEAHGMLKWPSILNDSNSYNVTVTELNPKAAMKKYGVAAEYGAYEIGHKLKNDKSPNTITTNSYTMEFPKEMLNRNIVVTLNGMAAGKIALELASKELTLLSIDPSYKIISYNVYFMGNSFPEMLKGSSTNESIFSKTFTGYLKQIKNGDAISFDDIIVENKDGKRERTTSVSYVFSNAVKEKGNLVNGFTNTGIDERALLVINGQKTGSFSSMESKLKDLQLGVLHLELRAITNLLKPTEAIKKYGAAASYGAVEITLEHLALTAKK